MRHRGHPASPSPVLVAIGVPVLLLALLLAVLAMVGRAPAGAPLETDAAAPSAVPDKRTASLSRASTQPAPPAPATDGWSGFAFDACRAPSQAVMDRWRTSSPFSGVGIYLGGIHRACEQKHLTSSWVTRQVRSGWKLLPIWVGPQASCTSYDHRIDPTAGKAGRYIAARNIGVAEARRAAAVARGLRLPRGEVIFYDIEPFDTGLSRCRGSSLAFLEEWTKEIHRLGYRSGVYSHVNAAISLLSRTPPGYVRPDAAWYAWIDRAGTMPREYVADAAFMRTSRVHQYALDTRVEFGGIAMDIDWNFVSLGATSRPTSPADCDWRAARARPRALGHGARGPLVRVVQCLVLRGNPHPVKTSGHLDRQTVSAVRRFQEQRGLRPSGTVDRPTWTSLLAHGGTSVLRKGAKGEQVQRLQRTLNVALARPSVEVDGAFGPSTARAVREYSARIGLRPGGVVTPQVWKALSDGKVLRPEPASSGR